MPLALNDFLNGFWNAWLFLGHSKVLLSPLGTYGQEAHRSLGQEGTANVLAVMGVSGVVMAGVGLWGGTVGDIHPSSEECPTWPEPVMLAGLGLMAASFLYDAIHAPVVARRDSKRTHLLVAPDRVMLVCEF